MRENKGFTLIELLAVIVILAIIALIATPIILNIINDSREKANLRSVEAFAKATETAVARVMMDEDYDGAGITCESGASGTEAKCYGSTGDIKDKTTVTITYSGSTVKCSAYSYDYKTSNNSTSTGTTTTGIVIDEVAGTVTVGNCQVGSSSQRYTFNTGSSKSACQDNAVKNENEKGKHGDCSNTD